MPSVKNKYNIDKDKHYFCLMRPIHIIKGFVSWTHSSDREKWVECEIVEDRYKVDDGYKITLKSIEPGYGQHDFYQRDFASAIGDFIIEKTRPDMHVEEIKWHEPLCGSAYLVHNAYVVV